MPTSRKLLLGTALLTVVAPIAWGSTYPVTQLWLPPDRPLFAAVVRALPVGLVFLLVVRRLPAGSWWWKSIIVAALNIGAFFPLIFVAAYRLPSGLASTISASSPLIVIFLAAALLAESITVAKVVGALIGTAGVALLVLRSTVTLDVVGLVAIIIAAVIFAVGAVLVKLWRPPVSLLTFTSWQLTLGGLMILPIAVFVEGPPPAVTPVNVAALAYLALIGTAAAYLCWFNGLRKLPASTASVLGLMNPVAGTALGVILLGEAFGPNQAIGLGLVLFGIALVSGVIRLPRSSVRSSSRGGTPDRPPSPRRDGPAS